MEYMGTLIAVSDMERAKKFYTGILERRVTADFGANVTLSGGIFLQTADTWRDFIKKPAGEVRFFNNACELYFEEQDFDGFLERLAHAHVKYVLPPLEHSWGQRVVRFYDPDGHIIEMGETLSAVVCRFAGLGMTQEEIAKRMDVPLEAVTSMMD